jgi:hypothetical protein
MRGNRRNKLRFPMPDIFNWPDVALSYFATSRQGLAKPDPVVSDAETKLLAELQS